MKTFFLYIYDKIAGHRLALGLFMVLFVCGCLALAFHLKYQEDISAFLPLDEQSQKYASVYGNIGSEDKIAVIFKTKDDSTEKTEEIENAMSAFGDILQKTDTTGCISDLQVQVDEDAIYSMLDFIWQNYPYMLSQSDYQRMDSLVRNKSFVSNQMHDNHEMLLLPTSGMMTQSLPYDPLHFSSSVVRDLQKLKLGNSFQVLDGYIFTKSGDKGLIFIKSPYGVSESYNNAKLAEVLDDAINTYYNNYPKSDVIISAIGAPLIAVTNATQIKQDSIIAVVLAVVLIFVVLFFSFRRFSDLLWIGISMAIGWLFALACMALFKTEVSIIVIGIGSVIIGIAVNYPLHFIDHLKHESDKRNVLKDMIQPLLIGNITTVSAFLCLVVLDAEAMRDLGLFGSLMLIGTILFVLIVLPILVPAYKDSDKGHFMVLRMPQWQLSKKVQTSLFWVGIIITVILFFFSFNTSFDSNVQHINYMTDSQRDDLHTLTEGLNGPSGNRLLYAVAEGSTMENALENNEALLDSLKRTTGISLISGINDYIPSRKRQLQNIERWNSFWKQNQAIVPDLTQNCQEYGFNPAGFEPFVSMTKGNIKPQSVTSFIEAMPLISSNYIIKSGVDVKVVNFVYVDSTHYDNTKALIRSHLGHDMFAFDATDVSSHLVTLLSDSFNYIGFVCGFVVFFFLWISFARLELSLLSFLPLAVSWIWILGCMDIFDIKFNIVNIILATFIFGQGDDYTIFITEGLMYEYAYGKKRIAAYKNSVALSSVIMLIGLGTLIIARHPALRSLAEVAIVGMVVVVLMAFYLPPLIYRWITTVKGEKREYPLTIKRILYSLYALMAFLIAVSFAVPYIMVYMLFVKRQDQRSAFIHRILYNFSRFVVYRVPGTHYKLLNPHGEDFQRPALIICNHQSQLDLMAVLALTPKLTILTKDWVWNNPYYGFIIRTSEFYPVTNGIDSTIDGLRDMIRRGYSIVVFPEGTRSASGIQRFHKGAFLLAKELGLDILPLHVHGINDVLPRHDFMLREGSMTMEIGERMPASEVMMYSAMELRKHFHVMYVNKFEEMRRRYETSSYFIPFIRYKYMYKGPEIEHRASKVLNDRKLLAETIDRDFSSVESYMIDETGQGELSFIFAKVHPNIEVYADFTNEDDYLVASNLQGIPENLHLGLTQPYNFDFE